MSTPLAHFSAGAVFALIIFRIIDFYSKKITKAHFLRYDIFVAIMGGFVGLIPTIINSFTPYQQIFVSHQQFLPDLICDMFFLSCFLDSMDPNNSILFSFILFGLLVLDVTIVTIIINKEKIKEMFPKYESN
jgi:hypothetical protein